MLSASAATFDDEPSLKSQVMTSAMLRSLSGTLPRCIAAREDHRFRLRPSTVTPLTVCFRSQCRWLFSWHARVVYVLRALTAAAKCRRAACPRLGRHPAGLRPGFSGIVQHPECCIPDVPVGIRLRYRCCGNPVLIDGRSPFKLRPSVSTNCTTCRMWEPTEVAAEGDGVDEPGRRLHDAPHVLHRRQDALRPRQVELPQHAQQPVADPLALQGLRVGRDRTASELKLPAVVHESCRMTDCETALSRSTSRHEVHDVLSWFRRGDDVTSRRTPAATSSRCPFFILLAEMLRGGWEHVRQTRVVIHVGPGKNSDGGPANTASCCAARSCSAASTRS